MSEALLKHVAGSVSKKTPRLKVGQTLRVHQKIKEGEKERVQLFEGLLIRVSAGSGVSKTFTVRKIVEGIGVEKIFPVNSPIIQKIEVLKDGKVRSAKLYYMRDLSGKSTRLRELLMDGMGGDEVKKDEKHSKAAVKEEQKEEIAVAEEAAPAEQAKEAEQAPVENKEE